MRSNDALATARATKGVEGTGGRVWRSRREESDRVVFFGGRRMRFLLSSLCFLGSLCFLFFAAADTERQLIVLPTRDSWFRNDTDPDLVA